MNLRIREILGMSLMTLITAAVWAAASPNVEFEKTSFDFGKPMEGEKVTAVFSFKNIGDAALEITKVQAGCGCTDAKATESKIEPGKSAAVEAVFNTVGYRSQVSKTVTVTTNDPAHQSVVLTIKGEVVPIVELKPQAYLNLGDLKPGSISLSDITAVPNVKQSFKIVRVESSGKLVSVLAYDRQRNRTGNYCLKIRVIAGSVLGRFYEQLSIITDLPGNVPIRFPVYGNVIGDAAKNGKS